MSRTNDINPSIQCSVCGQWKRLTGKVVLPSGQPDWIQRFYPCCEQNGRTINHDRPVCDDCCKAGKCPNAINSITQQSDDKESPQGITISYDTPLIRKKIDRIYWIHYFSSIRPLLKSDIDFRFAFIEFRTTIRNQRTCHDSQ